MEIIRERMLIIVFFIAKKMGMCYILSGEVSLPGAYWRLSIIILITARRVPISKVSWISADTTFFSSFIFSTIFLSPPFYDLIIPRYNVVVK